MMGKRPEPPPEEANIGLGRYLTDTQPLRGRLKKKADDFIVNEIPDRPPEDSEGELTIAKVTVTNWETNRLVRALSKSLGISKKRIGFAGTKDKRAVTSQFMSFRCGPEALEAVNLKDVVISDIYRSNRELTIGDLYGNDFHIFVRDIIMPSDEARAVAKAALDQLLAAGGFPNYFGVQRFGSIRPITHIVGKKIVQRDMEGAVMTYICNPYAMEPEDSILARKKLEEDRDFASALKYYPSDYVFERSMIHHLSTHPDDWTGALETLPDNLKMMFIHAYQSYLFNRIITMRLEKGLPLNEPVEGDMVIPLNKKKLPDHYRPVKAEASNLNELKGLIKSGHGYLSGLVFGQESIFAEGEMGEIEHRVIEAEKIEQEDFNIFEVQRISSRGMRRELLSPMFDLKWRVKEDPSNPLKNDLGHDPSVLELKFSLFRGAYATSFLRELMKGEITDY